MGIRIANHNQTILLGREINHNQTLVAPVAGIRILNHNQTVVKTPKTAPWGLAFNHNQTLVRG